MSLTLAYLVSSVLVGTPKFVGGESSSQFHLRARSVAHRPKSLASEPPPDIPYFVDNELARFVVYHKTGWMLSWSVRRRCLRNDTITFAYAGQFPDWIEVPVVHFVRDPIDVVKSAYLYHQKGLEPFTKKTNFSPELFVNDPMLGPEWRENETFQEMLLRLPTQLGVRAQYLQSYHSLENKMMVNWVYCKGSSDLCKQVCLEDFMKSSVSYNRTWLGVLDFLGIDHGYMDCIAQFDVNRPEFGDVDHTTSSDVSPKEAREILRYAREADDHLTQGTLQAAGEHLRCI